MTRYLARVDDLLRAGSLGRARAQVAAPSFVELATCIIVGGMLYGAAMGSSAGWSGDRAWQACYSAIKLPLLLLATFALCLPFFFVLNTLVGLRRDFAAAVRKLLAAQAVVAVVLVALAPLILFWYTSSDSYAAAILANAALLGTASVGAQIVLGRDYAPLIARHPRHRVMLRVWLVLYAFVGIQMGWILRPFIGAEGVPVEFFRDDTWGNAYVIVGGLIWRLVSP